MEKAITKQHLIEYISFIRDCELEKPLGKIDEEFVSTCVTVLLKLQNKKATISDIQIEHNVNRLMSASTSAPDKTRVHKPKKILLVAAIIAILCALLAVISIGHNIDYWHCVMNEKFGSVFNVPVGEEFVDGNDEFIHAGESVIYTKTDKFFENEPYDVLIPTKLPDEIGLVDILITSSTNNIAVSFDAVITAYEIYLNTQIPQEIIDLSNETVVLNNLTCYILRFEDINSVQIYFEHNGNYYCIGGTDEQILLDVIENLEI